jgi:ProP effector
MSKNTGRRRELAAGTLAILAERFPLAFALKGRRRPLKIGIDRDLSEAAPDLSPPVIKQALRLYVGAASYGRALVEGAERIDLAGAPAGVVSTAAAATAKAKAAQLKAAPKVRAAPAVPAGPIGKVSTGVTPSGRPRLTLASLREAAQRRKSERGDA